MNMKDMKSKGPTIVLNEDVMKRLALENVPGVGAKLRLEAIAVVEKAAHNENKSGKKQEMTIKITDMILNVADPEVSLETKFYRTAVSKSGKVLMVDL